MASTGSVRIVKQFTYRGGLRTFSNRYAIGTNSPPDSGHWTALCDAIVLAEKLIYVALADGGAKIIQAVGYDAGSEIPVFTKNYTTDGTLSGAGTEPMPGDCAALIRYSTPDRSTKNHPVYCFNYHHCVRHPQSNSNGDAIATAQHTAYETYAAAWIAGFSDGTTTFHRSRPTGDLCTGYLVPTNVTHRDLAH